MTKVWKIIGFLIGSVLLLSLCAAGGLFWTYQQLNQPFAVDKAWEYTLAPKTNLWQVSRDLENKQLMNPLISRAWVFFARWQQKANQIKAGEYAIPAKISPIEFLDILTSGKTIQYSLTVPEGFTFKQLLTAIQQHPQLEKTLINLDSAAIMAKLGLTGLHPEGRFFPDTYHFPRGTTDLAFLQRANQTMEETLKTAWEKRQPNLPVETPYQALILASIVEKETAVPSERTAIAGVFVRRLQKGMLLQTDPTVIYALGDSYNGNIRSQDLQVDNPYNTYRYAGLPPTPIALPSKEAIQAALNPAEGNTLYFVAKGDGSHQFSATLNEHECAVIEFQLKEKAPQRFKARCGLFPQCAACRG